MSTENRLEGTRREAALTVVQAGDDQSNGKETDEVKTYFGSKTTRCAGGLNLTACAQPKENKATKIPFL